VVNSGRARAGETVEQAGNVAADKVAQKREEIIED
jgi:hypothetical protein